MDPSVSVVIHFLDAGNYLDAAVRGVLRQTERDWELVLVDGGSRDASARAARFWARRLGPRARLLRHEGPATLGVFSSRLAGARAARAPLVALLDADDVWEPSFLERRLTSYRRAFGDRAGFVYGPARYWWPGRRRRDFIQPVPPPGLYRPPALLKTFSDAGYMPTPCNSAVLVDRRTLLAAERLVGKAAEKLGDDQYLWSFLALRIPILVEARPLFLYRQRPDSACGRAAALGKNAAFRRRHLAWLKGHLRDQYQGKLKNTLLREIGALAQRKAPAASAGLPTALKHLRAELRRRRDAGRHA